MREIKFRGLKRFSREWIYGMPTYDMNYIFDESNVDSPDSYEVDEDTIGQFTGIYDMYGVEIFEGDLLRIPAKEKWEKTNYVAYEVFFHDNDCADVHIGWQMNRTRFQGNVCGTSEFPRMMPKNTNKMEVIGNIHENKDLLK